MAIAERAYQQARGVREGARAGRGRSTARCTGSAPIIHHPDVRRMLMTMRAQTEGMRALAYVAAAALDVAHHHPDAEARKRNQAFVEFMMPVVKGWCTEMGIEVASLGVQVHGGMGFIEETGAAQYCAMRASPRSTRARPASRRTTSSAARSRATAARRAQAIAAQVEATEAALARARQRGFDAMHKRLRAARRRSRRGRIRRPNEE